MNSQEQIMITTNKNNLQGDQTLDINKDTINIKESLCWCSCPHSWVCRCWWPQPRLCHSGLCLARLDIWLQSIGSLSHHQLYKMSAISKWLQALPPGAFVFIPVPRLWVLGKGWMRGCAHLLIKEGNLRTNVGPVYLLPACLPYASVPAASGHVFFLPASPTYWHFKNSRMYPMMDISSPSLPIHKKVPHSITPPAKAERRVFFLFSWRETGSHAPGNLRATNSLQLRDRRKTLKNGISSHALGPPHLVCKSLPELDHLSVGY